MVTSKQQGDDERGRQSIIIGSHLSKCDDMIREHFPMCPLMLPEVRTKYDCYRNSKQQEAVKRKNGSKSYWVDSAKELGMFDSKNDEQMAIIQMLKESDLEDDEEEAESNRMRIVC